MTAHQTTIDEALQARDIGIKTVQEHAGPSFLETACVHIVDYLGKHGPTSGEELTNACRRAGITPHDDRAFGAVYQKLSRQGLIEKCGSVLRVRGHMTSGGHMWRLRQ